MMDADQEARTGGGSLDGDIERTERLEEIIAEHGWPTYDLVGEDGEEAAWVIAQHSDLDPEFQAEALECGARRGGAGDWRGPGRRRPRRTAAYGTRSGPRPAGEAADPEIEDPANLGRATPFAESP